MMWYSVGDINEPIILGGGGICLLGICIQTKGLVLERNVSNAKHYLALNLQIKQSLWLGSLQELLWEVV